MGYLAGGVEELHGRCPLSATHAECGYVLRGYAGVKAPLFFSLLFTGPKSSASIESVFKLLYARWAALELRRGWGSIYGVFELGTWRGDLSLLRRALDRDLLWDQLDERLARAGATVSMRAGVRGRTVAVPVGAHALEYQIRECSDTGREPGWPVYGRLLLVSSGATAAVYSVERDYGERAAAMVHGRDAIRAGA